MNRTSLARILAGLALTISVGAAVGLATGPSGLSHGVHLAFNPQPIPPGRSVGVQLAFNPQPEPPGGPVRA